MNAGKCLGMGGLAVDRSAEWGAREARIALAQRSPSRVIGVPQLGLLATVSTEPKGA